MYADRATFRVQFVEDPGVTADEVWEVVSERPGFDFKWLYEEAEGLAVSGPPHVPNLINVRVNRTDWGADATTFEVLLTVSQWVLEQGAAATFGAAFADLIGRMHTQSRPDHDGKPLRRQEATERARWRVHEEYEVDADRLTVTSEEESDGSWTIGLAEAGRASYEVTLTVIDGLVVATRIKRTLDPGS